ncbi:TadE/TadG family type IV pilus assembly protein [Desulfohalobium retbaense]|uniref:TadE family protein n=1 Tax=Desulfohalobium retbaense (strain ATCC 49708 / DSM 5692 / JCM 16813 / HR100) TaxID=485915 RepID=C8X1N1_DESRD|nr:TadE family protein [Desulfohalobium retbaense]ACV68453.1 TadE family protein [Desulfohalobium retbaense DSM 5692]
MLSKMKFSNQRGAAAVEFAIVLPLLVLIFAGITEFGIAYYNKQVITNASREGARVGMSNVDPQDIRNIVYPYAKDRLLTFGPDSFSSDSSSININGCNSTSDYCKVEVVYNYTYLVLQVFDFFGANFDKDLDIKAATTMKMLP